MRKIKLLFVALATSLLTLSACSLFNDNDIAASNEFNPPKPTSELNPDAVYAGGVEATYDDVKVPNVHIFKSISYATNNAILNTYKNGGVNQNEYTFNNNEDYYATRTSDNYDLYVPKSADKGSKQNVVLFIHGGAWVMGFKSDVNAYVQDFANKGYIAATMKYKLMKRTMDDSTLSLFRNLDEIDACIKSIKASLVELGFDGSKLNLVLGGASSGAHLAMLYAYSRGQRSDMPIKFLIDAVGPVDIKPENWKAFDDDSDTVLSAGITASAIQTQRDNGNLVELDIMGEAEGVTWSPYHTMRIANGMCGIPYSLEDVRAATNEAQHDITNPNAASNSMTKNGGGEDMMSVTYWMNNSTNKYPMVCAYAGKDSVVGIAQYARLETVMNSLSIQHDYVYFKESDHTEITKEKDETAYNTFINKIETRLQAL